MLGHRPAIGRVDKAPILGAFQPRTRVSVSQPENPISESDGYAFPRLKVTCGQGHRY